MDVYYAPQDNQVSHVNQTNDCSISTEKQRLSAINWKATLIRDPFNSLKAKANFLLVD